MIIATLFGHGTYVNMDARFNAKHFNAMFKRELERQSADHFQQCLMAITTSKIENE